MVASLVELSLRTISWSLAVTSVSVKYSFRVSLGFDFDY